MIEESRPCHSLIKRLHSNAALFATTGGSANAYTADFTPDFTLTMDASFYLRIHATNTGASTLSVDGAAAKNLMKIQGPSFVALAPGDVIANGIYQVIRDQTGDRYLVISRIGEVAQKNEANTFTIDQTINALLIANGLRAKALSPGGAANTITLTSDNNVGGALSTGVGTIKFSDAINRDSIGFIKIYIGTTAYYIPIFAAN